MATIDDQCGMFQDHPLLLNTMAGLVDAPWTFDCSGISRDDPTQQFGPTFKDCADDGFHSLPNLCIGGIKDQHACSVGTCNVIDWNGAVAAPCASNIMHFVTSQVPGMATPCCNSDDCTIPSGKYACDASRTLQLCVVDATAAQCVEPISNAICSGNFSVAVAPPSGSTDNTLSHAFPTNEPNTVTHGFPGTTQVPIPPTLTAPPSVTTAPPSVATAGTPSLDDCISKKASCAFTATSTGSAYPQETQIGAAFDNCDSTVNVTQHFSGSVTITDNWSVDASIGFDLPKFLGLSVSTSIEHGKAVTMEQSYDYVVPPQARAVLVGTASFDAIFGNMNMKYSNHNANLNNVVYFKSDANQNPVVALRMFSCNEPLPTWNATAATAASGDGGMARYTPRYLIIHTLVLLALLI
ncbi:hypothetical protein B0H19DRAFT_1087790 [Mycena capillaripes]|nr:hypothetical protein B0H19DRAFT_1087790 [Mycena capillaripes]